MKIFNGNLDEVAKYNLFDIGSRGELFLLMRGLQVYADKKGISVSPLYIPFMRVIADAGQLIFQFFFWRETCYQLSLWPVLNFSRFRNSMEYVEKEDE